MQRFAWKTLLFLILLGTGLTAGCAHFSSIDPVPSGYLDRLAAHPMWLTVLVVDYPAGTFPPSEVAVVKRWEVVEKNGRAVRLKETYTSSLVGIIQKLHEGEPPHEVVDLRGGVDPEAFLPYPGQALEASRRFHRDQYKFADIDGRRFQILINGGRARIVFLPAPNDYAAARGAEGVKDVGIWTAPFGAESELLAHVKKLLAKAETQTRAAAAKPAAAARKSEGAEVEDDTPSGPFLHHDLSVRRRLRVVLDRSFPRSYVPSVEHALAKWNAAFKRALFTLDKTPQKLDAGACVSGFLVCLRWTGPADLAFTGANGYTELGFDPQTGLILGGIVTVINDDVQPPLKAMPKAESERVVRGRFDWDWLAEAMLHYGAYNQVRHPAPEAYVEYLVLHELGHINGFGHNFFASDKTTIPRPVTSVMSYPPFPVGHLATYLGDADLRRLSLVYGKEPLAGPDYCSTFEAMAPLPDGDGLYRKPAACDLFTVGNQADWYLRLARHGRFGVFTGYPDISYLSEELRALYRQEAARRHMPPLNVLTRLGFILADTSPGNAANRARIMTYLCSLTAEHLAAASQLHDFNHVALNCPAGKSR